MFFLECILNNQSNAQEYMYKDIHDGVIKIAPVQIWNSLKAKY